MNEFEELERIKVKRRFLGAAIVVFFTSFLTDCSTYNLERRLNADIKYWYDYYHILMLEKVPKWIDENDRTERVHFLKLPEYMQRKYIEVFWEMRKEGQKDLFYNRIAKANKFFNEGKEGWKTDRGQLLIFCGSPQYIWHIRDVDLVDPFSEQPTRMGRTSDISGNVYLIWAYYYRNFLIQYRFEYRQGGEWRKFWGIRYSHQRAFEMEMRKWWSPTDWDIWASILLDYVHRGEKNPTGLQGKIQ